ncbi:MAG: hypothetical protein BCS36_00930 [Desulfovibrio sp. MES5]|nr:MAG: hypothetical protein BCS36_00930 [Desulfovibrio sp. MES5]
MLAGRLLPAGLERFKRYMLYIQSMLTLKKCKCSNAARERGAHLLHEHPDGCGAGSGGSICTAAQLEYFTFEQGAMP